MNRLATHTLFKFSKAICRPTTTYLGANNYLCALTLWPLFGIKRKPTLSSSLGNKTNVLNANSSLDWLSRPCKESKFSIHSHWRVFFLFLFIDYLRSHVSSLLLFLVHFFLDDHTNSHEIISCQFLKIYFVHPSLQNFRTVQLALC